MGTTEIRTSIGQHCRFQEIRYVLLILKVLFLVGVVILLFVIGVYFLLVLLRLFLGLCVESIM